MTVFESLGVALFIIAVVFVLLTIVFVLINLSSTIIRRVSAGVQKEVTVAKQLPSENQILKEEEEEFSAGTLKLIHVEESTAAMIMAIVSDESGIPLSELCFKSIRLVESGK